MDCHSTHSMATHVLQHIDLRSIASILTVLSFSFVASLHCGIMCGPLLSTHCLKIAGSCGTAKMVMSVFYYNLGRIISYTSAGCLLGFFSGRLQMLSSFGWRTLIVVAGTLIVLLGVIQLFELQFILRKYLNKAVGTQRTLGFERKVLALSRVAPAGLQSFILGLVTVLFPCMTLTPALLAASTSKSALEGGVLLLVFCLGTIPIMTIAPSIPVWLSRFARSRYLAKVLSSLIIMSGIFVLFNLIGD